MNTRPIVVFASLFVASAAATADAQQLRLVKGIIGTAASADEVPTPATSFHLQDHIYLFTAVASDNSGQSAGEHHLVYKWYTGDAVAFSFEGARNCPQTPCTWSAWVSGTHLGVGHHRVQLYVDGAAIDSREFEITPGN